MWIIIKKRWFISFIGSSWPIQWENHKYSFMNKYKKEEFFTQLKLQMSSDWSVKH